MATDYLIDALPLDLTPKVGMRIFGERNPEGEQGWLLTIIDVAANPDIAGDFLIEYVDCDGRIWMGMPWRRRFLSRSQFGQENAGISLEFVEYGGPRVG